MSKSWIQVKTPDGPKLVPKEEYYGNNVRGEFHHVLPDVEPFVSPVDGTVISSRPQLREHNRKHGVTNFADYSPELRKKLEKERIERGTFQTKQDKQERIEILKHAYDKHTRR